MRFLAVFQASYKRATFRASLFIGVLFINLFSYLFIYFTNSYFLIFIIYNLSSLVFNVLMSL